jgi:hypothetical protein
MEKLTMTKSSTYSEKKGNSVKTQEVKTMPKQAHSPTVFKIGNEDLRITDEKNMN